MLASNMQLSWTFAPEMVTASGRPARSTTKWRLVPSLPRFVGPLPVCSPPRCWNTRTIECCPFPIDVPGILQTL